MGILTKFNLNDYINKYKSTLFIETGTWLGDGIQYASNFNFEKLYSIELLENLYTHAVNRFKDNNKISIINNNSCDGIDYILRNYVKSADKVIFWLDAHLPQFYTGGVDTRYDQNSKILIPLEEELKIIKSHKDVSQDVFLIDDLRMYERGPFEGGDWTDVINSGVCPHGIKFIFDLLGDTHDILRDYSHEGYIICTPKI